MQLKTPELTTNWKILRLFSFLLFCFPVFVHSQNLYDIKIPEKDYQKHCSECLTRIKSIPKEVQFGIRRDENYNLYFLITRKEWFNHIVENSGDGIAIDIVSRDRYLCSGEKSKNELVRGELQPPLYLKDLKKNMLPSQNGELIVKMGAIPEKFRDKEIEFNIVILRNKYLCYYNSFYDLKTYRWDLLDMGLFFDTLTYKSSFDTTLKEQEKFILQHKILKFEIPFERNKSVYSPEDIKPLYDSLRLTDFDIQKISIRAYSSVEGNEERNVQLQQERAQSIVSALQTFQTSTINTDILATENWVDFLNDITLSTHSSLSELSKSAIKEKLKDKKLLNDLEPYLQKHRKAVVILELSKKNRYKSLTTQELVTRFSKSLVEKNLKQAIEIQNSVFEKVRNHEEPISLIDKLEIPERVEYSLLLNKNSIFKYLMNEADVYATFKELQELQDLIPQDAHLKYNLAALKFKVWLLGDHAVNPPEFKKEIENLKKYGIAQNLIRRMLINYEILMSEYYMQKGDFVNKDKSLRYIYSNYQYVPLSDFDYLSLAQYFASFARYDWATRLLDKKAKSVDVNEDLLFYYINLTIIDDKLTRRPEYRTILLNAYNLNRTRFCELFQTFGKGGVTFQLLENEYLRKTYCENCK